jgi:RecA/RadA recombinase
MSPVDTKKHSDVIAAINKKYSNAVRKGSEIENPQRLSTGSLELDMAMGGSLEHGFGIPLGRISRIAGPYSTGKSLIGWNIIANAQRAGMKCAYFNVEKQFTPEFTSARGVDVDALDVVNIGTIEGIGEAIESLLSVVHLIVVDSTKQAISLDALNAPLTDWRPGLEARAWGKAIGVITERFDQEENTIVLIDQVRVKSFSAGGAQEPAGGAVLDHGSSMTVVLQKGSWLFYNEQGFLTDKDAAKALDVNRHSSGEMLPNGRVIKARVEKSRVSRPLLPATMWLDINTSEFDTTYELLKWGVSTGVIEDEGRGNYYYTPEGGERTRFYGERKVRELLAGDLTLQDEIRLAAFSRLVRQKD